MRPPFTNSPCIRPRNFCNSRAGTRAKTDWSFFGMDSRIFGRYVTQVPIFPVPPVPLKFSSFSSFRECTRASTFMSVQLMMRLLWNDAALRVG